jgi:hypothetical protein
MCPGKRIEMDEKIKSTKWVFEYGTPIGFNLLRQENPFIGKSDLESKKRVTRD